MQIPNDYNQQEINLHRAAQLISLTGVNLQNHLPDDSHTTMVWNTEAKLLLGRSFELNNKRYCVGIRLYPFELALFDENLSAVQAIEIGGIDKPALYSIWEDWLRNMGFKGELINKVHYELPQTPGYHAMRLQGLENEFADAWSNLRSLANNVMESLNIVSGTESEVNIWPHHFDTGVYYPIATQNDETIQSIGAGLAIADSMIREPYFYIYGWTKEGVIEYKNAPKLEAGQWLTKEWQGAVLKASDITDQKQVSHFLKQAFDFLKAELVKNN